MCSPNTIPGFPPVSGFSLIRRKEHAGSISQIAVWHHCCIWRAMNWQLTFTLINCVWKHFTFGWQWLLMSGTYCDKASRPLMDSGGSLYRELYFRTLTKCLLKFMGMFWLISMNFGPGKILFSCPALPVVIAKSSNWSDSLLLFQSFPTDHWHKVVGGSSVCVWLDSHRGGQMIPLLPSF